MVISVALVTCLSCPSPLMPKNEVNENETEGMEEESWLPAIRVATYLEIKSVRCQGMLMLNVHSKVVQY